MVGNLACKFSSSILAQTVLHIQEAMWFQLLTSDLLNKSIRETTILEDNQSAISLVPRPKQVYIWWTVNWVIVGVNTSSATGSVCFCAKKFASWLFMMTHNFTWANFKLIGATTCHYAHINMPQFYQWMCPEPIFQQGRRARMKNLVSGDKTSLRYMYVWLRVSKSTEESSIST